MTPAAHRFPNDSPTFFIDRSLGSHFVGAALADAGAKIEVHDDHFAPDEKDVVWLGEAGRRSWVVLTKDARIRKRTLEWRVLMAAAVHAFFMGNASRTGPLMAKAFVSALPAMLQAIKWAASPVWTGVRADGRLTQLPQDLDSEAEPEEDVD